MAWLLIRFCVCARVIACATLHCLAGRIVSGCVCVSVNAGFCQIVIVNVWKGQDSRLHAHRYAETLPN